MHTDFEAYARRVEEWAKDHPVKTRQTEFLKMFPNAILDNNGFINVCPCNLDREVYDECERNPFDCDSCFKKFWNEEVE